MANEPTNPQMDGHEIIKRLITLMGDDHSREGLEETPARVLKSYRELFRGYDQKPGNILSTVFKNDDNYDQMVMCKDIEFYSTCEHHLIPFYGTAHVAYIPYTKIVGLSKLARLVDCFSRRLQIQERITDQISEALVRHLNPKGVMVMLEAKHMCMCARGVNKQGSSMVTTSVEGVFRNEGPRREFFGCVHG